jgi:hypothetical protein
MQRITITISGKLHEELVIATLDSAELDEDLTMTPEDYARECIESVLATRRLAAIG